MRCRTPVGDLAPALPGVDIPALAGEALSTGSRLTRSAQDRHGRWHQLSVCPYLAEGGRVDGVVIVLADVHELKVTALRLAEARDTAEGIVDAVHASLVVFDSELRVLSANRAFAERFRGALEPTDGGGIGEISLRVGDLRGLSDILQELFASGRARGPIEVEVPGGERRAFAVTGRRMLEGNPTRFLLALDDVTEAERGAAAAGERERAYRKILASALDPVILWDPSGRIRSANEATVRVLGYQEGELIGTPIERLIPTRAGSELIAVTRDGREIPIELRSLSLDVPDGPLSVSIVADISERRDAERKVREYQARLRQMAFDAAVIEERERRRIAADLHDQVVQSLALAQVNLSTLQSALDGRLRAEAGDCVRLIEGSLADIRTLIFDLSPPVLCDLGLGPALAWLADWLEERYGLRVEIRDDRLPRPLDVEVAALVFRAVRELLINVSKHARTSSATVTIRRDAEVMVLDVEDGGAGFDPAQLAAAPNGFGLFSVREQIDRLGGAFQLSSTPGHGTRIQIAVPLGAHARR